MSFYSNCSSYALLRLDLTVTCFLSGGPLLQILWRVGGYRNFDEFLREASRPGGLPGPIISRINKEISNSKVKASHTRYVGKIKGLGPPANHPDSRFLLKDKNIQITVSDYFNEMSKSNPAYKKLKYPGLPTVNLGTNSKPRLLPCELMDMLGGQSRSRLTPEITAQVIRHSAILPDERFKRIIGSAAGHSESAVEAVRSDPTCINFGVSAINAQPLIVSSQLLPPPKLEYRGGKDAQPGLAGSWNVAGKLLQQCAGEVRYGYLMISMDKPRDDWVESINKFDQAIMRDFAEVGVNMVRGGAPLACSDQSQIIEEKLRLMRSAKIIFVLLNAPAYEKVKFVAESLGILTQCVKWSNVLALKSGFGANLVLKVNTKLGGMNHCLKSRLPSQPSGSTASSSFQRPPASLSWVFDRPCMMVGIDVSHPDASTGKELKSMAAVVASMDGYASKYVAHLSAQASREEMVSGLSSAMESIFKAFQIRNSGRMPEHVLVYRDGVSDSQFDQVLQIELVAIKNAVALCGYEDSSVKIAVIICQKGHKTRLAYYDENTYINLCPGMVVDEGITSTGINEFYLNSHTAIQGTARPCKYSLIHDEIGFKMIELQLLTYWTCFLNARCNKSVSYATPAYYAHHASKRGRALSIGGATDANLIEISNLWAGNTTSSSMFFI